jgi:PTS system nitrogen regulatory IIA component
MKGLSMPIQCDGPEASSGAAMNLNDFLSPANVLIDVRATDKVGLLDELARRAAASLKLPPGDVAEEIQKRDELGSTGIGGGVSIPHARMREVRKPFGLLARLRAPIEFEAIDGQPVDIVFLLLLPASSQLDQLNALAAVARRLRPPELLRRLREAPDAGALYKAVTADDRSG